MKVFYVSIAVALIIILAVVINCIALDCLFSSLIDGLDAIGDGTDAPPYQALCESFEGQRKFMALSVTHDVMLEIEGDFAQMLGAIEAGDDQTLKITKSHLIAVLKHARRLSGINSDSIF